MKQTDLTFMQGFLATNAEIAKKNNNPQKAFDWNKAGEVIKEKLLEYPNLKAEAGLQRDWAWTAGVIFEDGKPTNDSYTYLSSNWAIPTLIIESDGEEILEIECYVLGNELFDCNSKWGAESLKILGVDL